MLKLTVIGKDVSKSLSPKMHKFILSRLGVECSYDNISIPESDFKDRIEDIFAMYDGINVTIPYKLDVIPYLKSLEGDAKTFGSVNLIKTRDMSGYNTDGAGFIMMLENAGVEISGRSILVLGAGGVGRTVIKKLEEGGAEVSAFEMNKERLNKLHEEFPCFTPLERVEIKPYDIIINCTGVGMHKTEGISPVSEELIKLCSSAVDLIYVPEKSEFLRLAEINGKKILNGDSMLFYQAYYGDCIYSGVEPDKNWAKELYAGYKKI